MFSVVEEDVTGQARELGRVLFKCWANMLRRWPNIKTTYGIISSFLYRLGVRLLEVRTRTDVVCSCQMASAQGNKAGDTGVPVRLARPDPYSPATLPCTNTHESYHAPSVTQLDGSSDDSKAENKKVIECTERYTL